MFPIDKSCCSNDRQQGADDNFFEFFGQMSYVAFPGSIQVPDVDEREYEIITLPNSLRAILISDINADKAACAVDVRIGSLSDPPSLEGLAHFCEHLLFLVFDI